MKRYDMYQDYDMLVKPEEHVRGEWVYYDDAQATISRLTAELAQARAEAAAAYERAAMVLDTNGDSAASNALGQQLCCSGQMCGCQGADVGSFLQYLIRALATEPCTTALAEIVKQAVDAETRACAELSETYTLDDPDDAYGVSSVVYVSRAAILARLDQHKEEGEC